MGDAQATPTALTNHFLFCSADQKLGQLLKFLKGIKDQKVMIFLLTCACVDYFEAVLREVFAPGPGGKVLGLHGRMVQKRRQGVYQQFRALPCGVLVCTDVAARGIDVPDVSWIVQYDPPQDPDFFVHRVGRTARAGRRGESLTLLLPREDAYVELLRLRQVPMQEMACAEEGVEDPLPKIKARVAKDRDLLEKGSSAFISFIRAYKEHKCNFIFQFKKLDIGAIARSFCLLRLPRLQETVNTKVDFQEATDIDTALIPYKDKVKEAARQKRLIKQAKEKEEKQKQKDKLIEKGGLDKKGRKEARIQEAREQPRKRKGKHQQILEEWDELQAEERLHRKLKKGKISKELYEEELENLNSKGGASSSDDDDDSKSCSYGHNDNEFKQKKANNQNGGGGPKKGQVVKKNSNLTSSLSKYAAKPKKGYNNNKHQQQRHSNKNKSATGGKKKY